MKIKKCTWCNSSSFEFIAKRKDGYDVVKCKKCELFFLSEIPDNLSDYYTKTYFSGNDVKKNIGYAENYDLISPLFLYWQKLLLELISKKISNASLLEIGCATGNLLEILTIEKVQFSDIQGIDLSEYGVKVCKQKNLHVNQSTIDALENSQLFDVIFSAETMEHVDDLMIYIAGIKKHLKENGVFVFYVPAIKEAAARKLKETYQPFATNLEHLFFFTKIFFDKEFKKYFDCDVMMHEYTINNNDFIVGVVSNNLEAVKLLNSVLELIQTEFIENSEGSFSVDDLYSAAIISAKFYNYTLSEKILKLIIPRLSEERINFLSGIIAYHKGELYASEILFYKAFKHGAINILQMKILYSIKKELLSIVKYESSQELIKKSQEVKQKNEDISSLNQTIQQKEQVIQQKEQVIRQKGKEINMMKSSKFWKIREKYMKVRNKIMGK